MRMFFYAMAGVVLMIFASWAYRVNYETQDAVARVSSLRHQIAQERETLGVLRAEWAYLNRPDRLRRLAEMYFPELGLMPLQSDHFADAVMVSYPPEPSFDDFIVAAEQAANAQVSQ